MLIIRPLVLTRLHIISCLQQMIPVPPVFMEYSEVIMQGRPVSDHHFDNILILTAEVANLRAAIHSKTIVDSYEILSVANTMDEKLKLWEAILSPDWFYHTVQLPNQPRCVSTQWGLVRLYGEHYHTYSLPEHTSSWCNYRVSRILVNSIILDALKKLILEDTTTPRAIALLDKARTIRNVIHQLAADICASVPAIFGLTDDVGNSEEQGTLEGGFMLLMPLLAAGSIEGPSHMLRCSVVEYLNIIGHRMGIGHALADIALLETLEGMALWIDDFDGAAAPPSRKTG